VGTGRAWLGKFPVAAGRVLYIDAELHRQTFGHRLAKVAGAIGILSHEFADKIDVLPLRGRLRDLFALDAFFRAITAGYYKIIIIDALYRLLPRGHDENSNADVTALYNRVDAYAEMTGAAIVCVHHATKGSQTGKEQTAIGSGGGAMSRAVDAHITLRPHAEDSCVVMEASLRSFAPMTPVVLRWEYPIFRVDESLDPADLREPGSRRKQPNAPAWTPQTFAIEFVSDKPRTKAEIIAKADTQEISARKAGSLLTLAVEAGAAYEWTYADRRQAHRFANILQPIAGGVK
jgi:hypothetical protein